MTPAAGGFERGKTVQEKRDQLGTYAGLALVVGKPIRVTCNLTPRGGT